MRVARTSALGINEKMLKKNCRRIPDLTIQSTNYRIFCSTKKYQQHLVFFTHDLRIKDEN